MTIRTDGKWFKDEVGRTLLLRGVNLGGSSKVPAKPDGATWRRESLFEHRAVSFVGRPFPLAEADEHFSRLRRWGLTFLRFVITWEAIEHAGPGLYDEEYLDYLYAVVKKAGEYDIQMYIDPHQDVWSRFTGGDGAPGWTLEALGLELGRLQATGAAFTHQEHGDPYPRMIWPTNYAKYGCATMFSLFFGGNDLAPQTRIDGVPVQEFLQGHYIEAVKQVAERLRDLPHVVGYDTLNEPSQGWIGYDDLNAVPYRLAAQGPSPTIYQAMLLAAGYPQEVAVHRLLALPWQRPGRIRLNPEGLGAYRDGRAEVWRQNGVWDCDSRGQPTILRPDHFYRVDGRPVDFYRDFFLPFVDRFTREVRLVDPEALIFICPPPAELQLNGLPTGISDQVSGHGAVHEPHWYDGVTLVLQRYIPWLGIDTDGTRLRFLLGRGRRRQGFCQQMRRQVDRAETSLGSVPTLNGEAGIAYNLSGKAAYRSGDFTAQAEAMDDTLQAIEANLVGCNIWNYTADNSNERGDLWNDEDLSIFSRDQQTGKGGLDDGGRALEAVVRPYARAVPGEPLGMAFNYRSGEFQLEFRPDPAVEAPLEIYLPELHYREGCRVEAPGGRHEVDGEGQVLRYWPEVRNSPDPSGRMAVHRIRLTRRRAEGRRGKG